MTLERAAEILNPQHREHYDSLETVEEACRIGMRAIEKQIPKKTIARIENHSLQGYPCESTLYYCPCCNIKFNGEMIVVKKLKMKHCPNCGQALDWEGIK